MKKFYSHLKYFFLTLLIICFFGSCGEKKQEKQRSEKYSTIILDFKKVLVNWNPHGEMLAVMILMKKFPTIFFQGRLVAAVMKHRKQLAEAFENPYDNFLKGSITSEQYADIAIQKAKDVIKDEKLDTDALTKPCKACLTEYFKSTGKESKIHQKGTALLRDLKERGYNVYVLGNLYKDDHDNFMQRDEFKDLFAQCDGTIFSFKEGVIKPDLYKKLLEKHNLKSEQCFYVGRKKRYLDVVNKLGIEGVVFTDYNRTFQKLEQLKIL